MSATKRGKEYWSRKNKEYVQRLVAKGICPDCKNKNGIPVKGNVYCSECQKKYAAIISEKRKGWSEDSSKCGRCGDVKTREGYYCFDCLAYRKRYVARKAVVKARGKE